MRPLSARFILLFGASLAAAACAEKAPSPAKTEAAAPPPAPRDTVPAAPDSFQVSFATSRGTFVVAVNRRLSPKGVDRFYQMVRSGYFSDVRFFRVVPGFVAQFGMHGDPAMNARWEVPYLADEPVATSNVRGTLTYATLMQPNTRSNQFFLNLADNPALDPEGFTPFAKVVKGMEVVDALYSKYDEPSQSAIRVQGNAYLIKDFPKLDYIKAATIVGGTQ